MIRHAKKAEKKERCKRGGNNVKPPKWPLSSKRKKDTPQMVDIAASRASSESQALPENVSKNENAAKNEKGQNPTTESTWGKSETPGKMPKRIMETMRVATQRYGIDVMQVEKEDGEKQGKF